MAHVLDKTSTHSVSEENHSTPEEMGYSTISSVSAADVGVARNENASMLTRIANAG